MELEWTSAFETGNETVDLQHHYFINLIKRIEKAFKGSTDEDYKRKLITELKKYADFHFTSEENVAISLSLPEVYNHHERHIELLDEFNKKSKQLANGTLPFEDFLQFLIQWFTGHTFYEDKKLFQNHP